MNVGQQQYGARRRPSVAGGVRHALLVMALGFAAAAGAAPEFGPAPTEPAPRFSARVQHEIVRVQANGITRIERWQENMVRDGDTVWVERIRPGLAAHGAADDAHDHDHGDGHAHGEGHADGHDHDRSQQQEPAAAGRDAGAADAAASTAHKGHGHRHFDGDAAARWIERQGPSAVTLSLVDRGDRVVVSIPQAEFRTMGFDGRFDAAASLVPPAVIAAMRPEADAAAGATSRWFVDHSDGWVHRVLWSDRLQLALQIDSRREDGSLSRQVSVALDPAQAAQPPWAALAGFESKRYDEYLD